MSLRFSIIVTILSLTIFGFTLKKNKLSDPDKEKVLLEIVKYVVERGHKLFLGDIECPIYYSLLP